MTEHPIPILAYHSFSPHPTKAWQYALEPARLDEHFAYLRERNYFSLTLAECIQSKELAVSAKPVVFTFNGAFADFERVLPILSKYNFTATLFVPTAFVGQQSRWLASDEQRPLLDWPALQGLANLEIASLGHEHLNFAEVTEAAAKEDMARSKETLEDKLGLPCQTFAYPYGSYTATTAGLVKGAGFLAACTLQAEVSNLNHDVYTLPRFAMTNRTSLSDIVGSKAKRRFSFLDILRPKRQKLSAPEGRYIFPPLAPKLTRDATLHNQQERFLQVDLLKAGLKAEAPKVAIPNVDRPSAERPREGVPKPDSLAPQPVAPQQVAPQQVAPNPNSRAKALQGEAWQDNRPSSSYKTANQEAQERDIQRVTDLEQQGDFLADLQTWLAQQQGKHLTEYTLCVAAAERLQAAQEAEVFAPERVRAVYQTQAQLERAVANELAQHTAQQREQLQRHLDTLNALPTLEALQGSVQQGSVQQGSVQSGSVQQGSMQKGSVQQGFMQQSSIDNAKHIIEEYLTQLSVQALPSDVLHSVESMVTSLEQRLNASYRAGLQRLVQEATAVKAMDFLILLQRASNGLEQGRYPDLTALKQSLENILGAEGSHQIMQQRSQKFAQDLATAARVFETVSALNNEDVTTVRQILYYLLSQRDVFPRVSTTMQQELESSLQEAKLLLGGLEKDHQATQAIADKLVSSSVLDSIFGDYESDSSKNT